MTGNYDNVAPFYDALSRFVFGDAIHESQRFLIKAIPTGSSILIAGGGTGFILEEISSLHKSGLQIIYVEASKKMIDLSKKRYIGDNDVTFMHQRVQNVSFSGQVDVIITPFLLDNFSDTAAKIVFDKLHRTLNVGGLWLFVDFTEDVKKPAWQKLLLKLMYFFFKFFCNIEASNLPKIELLFETYKYRVFSHHLFFKRFICSTIYVKQ